MSKQNDYLSQHPYVISNRKDGFWYTYLPDESKADGRRPIKRKTAEEVKAVVIEYWKQQAENPTIQDIFEEWITYKLDNGDITKATRDRYIRQYNESCSDFGKRKVKHITELDVEEFCQKAITDHQLTSKGFSNLRTILYGIFKRAKKKKLVSFSITEVMHDMEISQKKFRKIIRPLETQVFSDEERPKVYAALLSNLDALNAGLLLMFKTGIRPGELAALHPSDFGKNTLHVGSTEIRYYSDDGKVVYEVRDFPKTEAGIRDIILRDCDCWLLDYILQMNPHGEYMFEKDGERIKTHFFQTRLETLCNQTNIVRKSMNKARKTYSSALLDSNIEDSIVISQMGHTNILTTKKYYYKDTKSIAQREQAINRIVGL